jgi:hypothetical protein
MTVDLQGGYTALHAASNRGHVSVVRLLVERAPHLLEMKENMVRGLSLFLCLSTDSWQNGCLPIHFAAAEGHVDILEVLCEHAPATLEAKNNVSGVWGVSPSQQCTWVRQEGWTPLHSASVNSQPFAVEYITQRVPYQVLATLSWNGVCVRECCESLMGVARQARHHLMWSVRATMTKQEPVLPTCAPGSCASRPLWSIRGGLMIST